MSPCSRPALAAVALAATLLAGASGAWAQSRLTQGAAGGDGQPVDPALAINAPPPAGVSQAIQVRPALQLRSTTTNNISLSGPDSARADTVVVATPRLDARVNTPGLRLEAALAADLVSYVGRSRADRFFPNARADATVQLAERLLFVDAGLSADTSTPNPFGLLDAPSQTVFTRSTTTRERISPHIDRELGQDARLQLRTDHSWVQNEAGIATLGDARLSEQTGQYELRPQPLGLRLQGQRQASTFSQSGSSDVTFENARASLLYAALPQQLLLIVTGGTDRGRFGSNDVRETVRGGGLVWTPTDRTRLDLQAEKRFFGTGWNVSFSHRSPFLGINAGLTQQATTYAAQVAALAAGADLTQLFDAMLSTRISNPAERAAAVQQLIAQRNLPTTLGSALNLYSATAQLQKGANLSLALLGVRHTVTLRTFYTRTEDLIGNDLPPLISSDARQYGSSLGLNRRLRPETTADVTFGRTRVVGFGANAATRTSTSSVRLGLSQAFSPRTTGTVSLDRLWIDSTVLADANQTSLTFGLLHRF
ncbi:TIGR03016 family PEP-CTERM system-associated outer membrane protein [Leptothrix discophora]|uniref:TIGR03016 family PEP-CTERM system-associated outer membrane protein n=1 Tax=Leptothrix discophora TaxID=89 RepID=A0ABT9G552_LEPDI|nr:TIGR03016 family PEP-CTERM system-associated outer membrane protein [Leptothrix discophora]MDP4301338.1 TIGR03016 family PEP-CTERM system-associated outer membrane protein [Leptothrix discophora]